MNSFKKFLIADFMIQFAGGLYFMATSWYIVDVTGNNTNVGIFYTLNAIFGILASFLCSEILDRFNKKKFLIAMNIFRISTIILPLIWLYLLEFNIYVIMLLAVGNGIAWNTYFPATKAIIPLIIGDKKLIDSNSQIEIVMQVGLFSSGALSGVIYKYLSFNTILFISSILFMMGVILLSRINLSKEKNIVSNESKNEESYVVYRYMRSNKKYIYLGIGLFTPFIVATCINMTLPDYTISKLGADSIIYGFLDMAYGAGACISGIVIIALLKKVKRRTVVLINYFLLMFFGIAMFMVHNVWLSGLSMCIFGLLGAGNRIILNTEAMESISDKIIGKIMMFWNSAALIVQLVITSTLGYIMDKNGSNYGFLYYCGFVLLGFVFTGVYYKQKNKELA